MHKRFKRLILLALALFLVGCTPERPKYISFWSWWTAVQGVAAYDEISWEICEIPEGGWYTQCYEIGGAEG
jgi:hypothetical protein